jgi:hypothetical protein
MLTIRQAGRFWLVRLAMLAAMVSMLNLGLRAQTPSANSSGTVVLLYEGNDCTRYVVAVLGVDMQGELRHGSNRPKLT